MAHGRSQRMTFAHSRWTRLKGSIVGMIGSIMDLSGHELSAGSESCDGLGFMLVAVLWSEHLWTLTLAFATYLILIYVSALYGAELILSAVTHMDYVFGKILVLPLASW